MFLLWIIFNSKLNWEIVSFGVVISLALSWFVQRFLVPELTLKKQWGVLKRLPAYLRYAGLLVWEIIKANFSVMYLILSDRVIVSPKLSNFHTNLKTRAARAALADSITLTPGTITVHMQGDEFLVHCLDESMESGLFDSDFEKQLQQIENGWVKEMKL